MTRTFPSFKALLERFGGHVQSMDTGSGDASYIPLADADIRPISDYLREECAARLVAVFAEDRRSAEGLFFNYYVFEQKDNPEYLVVRAPVSPDHPEFPSLSAELPALNWQEREIQDWFGL
jgi:Ni,Fe-hydrogenase III component G